jgi:hypothetical protein
MKKSTEFVNSASEEVGLEINIERTEYMLLSCHQNASQNDDIEIANQNMIQEEIKRRLNSSNAHCQAVQNLLSACLLTKNITIIIYKTVWLQNFVSDAGEYRQNV